MSSKRLERKNTISDADYLRVATEIIGADRDIVRLTEELAGARGIKSGILKRFTGMGGDKAALMELRRKAKMDDDERLKHDATVAHYALLEGVKMWSPPTEDQPQGAMFDEETAEAKQRHRDAHIITDGYNTMKAGGTLDDNPHEPGSRDHQTWATAYGDSERYLNTRGSMGAAVAPAKTRDPRKKNDADAGEAAPRKRGRSRGDDAAPPPVQEADAIGEPVGSA